MQLALIFSVLSNNTLFARAELAASDDDTFQFALENYNNWNLPFAKTFKISPGLEDDKVTLVPFPKDSYLLEMDPSAYFSIIFVDTSLYEADLKTEDMVTLNYTFYGQNGFEVQGYW